MTEAIEQLLAAIRQEADRADFPIDEPVYRRSGRDPKVPILYAGSLDALLCIVGRDLGKDEVKAGEPLIGAAGRLVRSGILDAWADSGRTGGRSTEKPPLSDALKHVLLTNTVPYKPPGNKAYPEGVRQRFRPFLERLLVNYWKGDHVITLGTESFQWFEPYADPGEFESLGATEARFVAAFHCRLPRHETSPDSDKEIVVYPLPHPSPLNRRWYARFPAMLADRLASVRRQLEGSAGSRPGR
jgi:uracil-DNA glycosylase